MPSPFLARLFKSAAVKKIADQAKKNAKSALSYSTKKFDRGLTRLIYGKSEMYSLDPARKLTKKEVASALRQFEKDLAKQGVKKGGLEHRRLVGQFGDILRRGTHDPKFVQLPLSERKRIIARRKKGLGEQTWVRPGDSRKKELVWYDNKGRPVIQRGSGKPKSLHWLNSKKPLAASGLSAYAIAKMHQGALGSSADRSSRREGRGEGSGSDGGVPARAPNNPAGRWSIERREVYNTDYEERLMEILLAPYREPSKRTKMPDFLPPRR